MSRHLTAVPDAPRVERLHAEGLSIEEAQERASALVVLEALHPGARISVSLTVEVEHA